MATYNWPGFGIKTIQLSLDQPNTANTSGWSGTRTVAANPWHAKWSAHVEFAPIVGQANVLAVRSFLAKQRGGINTFHLPASEGPQNANSGVTVAATVTAGARSMTISGTDTPLLDGQFVTVNGQLLQLTADQADSTILFEPKLRSGADAGTEVETAKPYLLAYLVNSAQGWSVDPGQVYAIAFDVAEAVGESDDASSAGDVWTVPASSGGGSSGGPAVLGVAVQDDGGPSSQVSKLNFGDGLDVTVSGSTATIDAPGGGGGSGGASAASRSALAATASASGAVYLAESGREGMFLWSSADLSALVTADAMQGIYVPPSSDTTGASGAWIRMFSGPVNAKWFGIVEGKASGANGAANYVAWLAMLATLRARIPAALVNSIYQFIEPIYFPTGWYEFSTTLDLTDATGQLLGTNTGGGSGGGTTFSFPQVTGVRTQRYNSTGATGVSSPTHRGGDGWIIDGIGVDLGFSGTEGEAYPFHLRSQATIRNFFVANAPGDGIYAVTDTGDSLADACHIENGRIINCRNGIFVDGSDSNIWTVSGVSISNCRQWGIWDSSFLGNTYSGCHVASNGYTSYNDGVSIGASVVSYSGNRYFAIAGQETGASTNAPSGTTADNTWWAYLQAGGVATGFPAWTSGMLVRAGGSYHTDSTNAENVFSGCYHESGQGLIQATYPSLFLGGMASVSLWKGSTAATLTTKNIGLQSNMAVQSVSYTGTDEVITAQIGEKASTAKTVIAVTASLAFPLIARLVVNGNDLVWNYANGGTTEAFRITGPNTTVSFGGAAAVPHCFFSNNFRVGNSANARLINTASAAPASGQHAKGDFFVNFSASATGPFAFQCTTAGTPGTFTSLYAMTAAKGAAYTAWTGTANRATKDTSTATLVDVAQTLKALIDDLQARGVI